MPHNGARVTTRERDFDDTDFSVDEPHLTRYAPLVSRNGIDSSTWTPPDG